MSSDITDFNINDIIFRGINIINKSKTFLDIVKDKNMSERKKLRLLRLLNMFPNFAEMLKVYKNIEYIDTKTYIENVINNIKDTHLKEDYKYLEKYKGEEYTFNY